MASKRLVLVSRDSELCGLVVSRVVPCWPCTVVNDWRQAGREELSDAAVWMVDLALGKGAVFALQAAVRGGGGQECSGDRAPDRYASVHS